MPTVIPTIVPTRRCSALIRPSLREATPVPTIKAAIAAQYQRRPESRLPIPIANPTASAFCKACRTARSRSGWAKTDFSSGGGPSLSGFRSERGSEGAGASDPNGPACSDRTARSSRSRATLSRSEPLAPLVWGRYCPLDTVSRSRRSRRVSKAGSAEASTAGGIRAKRSAPSSKAIIWVAVRRRRSSTAPPSVPWVNASICSLPIYASSRRRTRCRRSRARACSLQLRVFRGAGDFVQYPDDTAAQASEHASESCLGIMRNE